MRQRVISAILFVIVLLGGVFGGGKTFYLLFFLIAAGCLWEFTGLMSAAGQNSRHFRRVAGTVTALLPYLDFGSAGFGFSFFPPTGNFNPVALAIVLPILLIFLLFSVELFLESPQPFTNMGHYLLGLLYLG